MSKMSIVKEFWLFIKVRKRYWLAPIFFILILLGLLIVATTGSPLASLIYTLF